MVILNRTNCLISAYKFGRVGFVICDLYNVVRLNWAACGTAWGVSEPCCLEPVRLQPCFGLKFVLQDHRAKTVANWIVFFVPSTSKEALLCCVYEHFDISTNIHIYTHTHTHIHIYTYTHLHTYTYIYIYIYIYTYTYTYTYIYICIYIYIYIYINKYIYIYLYINIYTHIHIHIIMHIHIIIHIP
jgi:hypothetical protein